MTDSVAALRRRRLGVLLLNLAYFLFLLAAGFLVFLRGVGKSGYLLAAACAAVYLLAVRPATKRYAAAVREAILRHTVCGDLEDLRYDPKGGVSPRQAASVVKSSSDRTFVSREHISGRCGELSVELADVSFPILENRRNAIFNGAYVQITWPGAKFPAAAVDRGKLEELQLPKNQLECVRELGSLIPGSLYLRSEGQELRLLLRGRFLGFPLNPLMPINETSLSANPFPELKEAVRLARLMGMAKL